MKRLFLLGYPVGHSISPAIHNSAFRTTGLDWEYALLETPPHDLARVAARLRAADCAGANVTIPHKQAILQYLDDLSASARKVGAVNTIFKRDGRLIGENTDTYGFIRSLTDARFSPRGKNVVVLGAGGDLCPGRRGRAQHQHSEPDGCARGRARQCAPRSLSSLGSGVEPAERHQEGAFDRQCDVGWHGAERARIADVFRLRIPTRNHRLRPRLSSGADQISVRGRSCRGADGRRARHAGVSRHCRIQIMDGTRSAGGRDVSSGA